jgi:hypothetical protein
MYAELKASERKAMPYKIILTHGRHQEVADGVPAESEGQNLAEVVADALNALFLRRADRGDGLPDGYKVFDDRGQLVKAEWTPVPRARRAPGSRGGLTASSEQ